MHRLFFYSASIGVASFLIASCDESFSFRFDQAFRTELLLSEPDSVCGPVSFATLVPDCPVGSACFTSACEAHNQCYGMCDITKKQCDDRFFQDMTKICSENIPLDSPDFSSCQYFAVSYWLAVQRLGGEAFEATQEGSCPPDSGDDLPVDVGACCQPGSPPTCEDQVEFTACPAQAVFLSSLTCDELNSTFGGCPTPPNDQCTNAFPACANDTPNPNLGLCAGNPMTERGLGVCDVTLQDCTNGMPCLPVTDDVFRCTLETDNRLASSDGPPAGGECEASGEEIFQADVWFEYTAPCDGTMVVRMCDAVTYDSILAVYGANDPDDGCLCPSDNDQLLQCNDDFCGFSATVSGLTVEGVVANACYLIRVGGWSPDGTPETADRGISEIDIGVFCDPADMPGPNEELTSDQSG